MSTVECPHCGRRVVIDRLDDPPRFVEHAATEGSPRKFVIYGGNSHWLLHRCEIAEDIVIDLREHDTPDVAVELDS